MPQKARVSLLGYGVAIASVALAFAFRLLTARALLDHAPLLPFVAAVLVSSWFGGVGPGLIATLLRVWAAAMFYTTLNSFCVNDPTDVFNLALFGAVGVLTSILCEQLHRYRGRASQQAGLLEQVHDAIFTWRRDGTDVAATRPGGEGRRRPFRARRAGPATFRQTVSRA